MYVGSRNLRKTLRNSLYTHILRDGHLYSVKDFILIDHVVRTWVTGCADNAIVTIYLFVGKHANETLVRET